MNKLIIMDKYQCPICKIKLESMSRYPNYICNTCMDKATDKNGRKLTFCNIDFSGGFIARYTESNEIYNSHICYIDGIQYYADEARFGGIVIEKI